MRNVGNPHRHGRRLAPQAPYPSVRQDRVAALLDACPAHAETPLIDAASLARSAGISALWVKDERRRMGLGSFKALGAAYAIARQAVDVAAEPDGTTLAGRTYVAASAGNHGLSVAAGARVFGADAVIYIADAVPEEFAARLQAQGAKVRRQGADYAGSMVAAQKAAAENGWVLLSDSSWPGYIDLPLLVMEGYLQLAAEATRQCPGIPTHVLVQAGVGGLAGAVAAHLRQVWGDAPRIVVVEPENAPALQASIEAGRCVTAPGPDSIMGRLDCKEPSLIALNGLARDADMFLTLGDQEVADCLPALAGAGLETTPSGGAGAAACLISQTREGTGMGPDAQVLAVLSEAPL